jgi:hypothetical protein
LTSRSNLAAAYRDGDRVAEAIPLLERTLADRERMLGPEHLDTQATRRKLAAAYQDAGRTTEAIPLLEQTSADRKPLPRADRPDTQAARKNAGKSHPVVDRVAGAIPPTEQAPVSRESQPPDGAAAQGVPTGLRRPPAAPARRVLPAASWRRRKAGCRAGRPLVHQANAGTASRRRSVRSRGCRGDHGGRPGRHCDGVRQVRGGSVRLLPLDAS